MYPLKDETRDIRSNIALPLREGLRAKPVGLPKAKGYILPFFPESSPITDSIIFFTIIMVHLCFKQAQPNMCHSFKVEEGVEN